MCVICAEPEIETAATAEAGPDADFEMPDIETVKRLHLQRMEASRGPLVICPECEWDIHPAERGDIYRDLCASCETRRLEALVAGLVSPRRRQGAAQGGEGPQASAQARAIEVRRRGGVPRARGACAALAAPRRPGTHVSRGLPMDSLTRVLDLVNAAAPGRPPGRTADVDAWFEQFERDHPVPADLPVSFLPPDRWPARDSSESFARVAAVAAAPHID